MFVITVVTIHRASNNPRLASGFHLPRTNGSRIAEITLTIKAQRNRTAISGRLAFFQRAIGPTPIKNIAGAIKGTKTLLKYGGPTDSLPRPNASMISGYNVPSNTEPAA